MIQDNFTTRVIATLATICVIVVLVALVTTSSTGVPFATDLRAAIELAASILQLLAVIMSLDDRGPGEKGKFP